MSKRIRNHSSKLCLAQRMEHNEPLKPGMYYISFKRREFPSNKQSLSASEVTSWRHALACPGFSYVEKGNQKSVRVVPILVSSTRTSQYPYYTDRITSPLWVRFKASYKFLCKLGRQREEWRWKERARVL